MSNETEHQVILKRYELERTVRTDALGKTWRALDLESNHKVDLRIIPDWADRAVARAIASQASLLKHPSIVGTVGFLEDGETVAYILEANDGETIQQRRVRRPRRHFEISEIKPWLRTMTEALEYLHGQGWVHGAIYVGSFLIEGADLRITDLATAPMLLPQASLGGTAALATGVMSPQVLGGLKPTTADDIYSLGALIYDLLTGQPLFSSGDIQTQVQEIVPPTIGERREQLEIPSPPLPEAWEAWISAALSKEPKRRPSLEDFGILVRTGQFNTKGGRTTRTLVPSAKGANSPTTVADATMKGLTAKPQLGLLIPLGAALLAISALAGVYFLKVKPRNEFKLAIDNAFEATRRFDELNPKDHEPVIGKWHQFESDWQARVEKEQPEFQTILTTAKTKRAAREQAKFKDEALAQEQANLRRKAYLEGAKTDFEMVKIRAVGGGDKRAALIVGWKSFIDKYDVDYQGGKLKEMEPLIAHAKLTLNTLEKAIAEEKKAREDFLAAIEGQFTQVKEARANPQMPDAEKIKCYEELLTKCNSGPPSVATDARLLEIKVATETSVKELKTAMASATPPSPLDLDGLFANSAGKAFSKIGKQRLLKKAQEALKASGQYEGETNGDAGEATHKAILAFQSAQNLPLTAALDEGTLAAMRITELIDDATPPPSSSAKPAGKSSAGSRSKSKPKEEEKSVVQKGADGLKKVGKAIGGFFSGQKKD